MENSQQINKVKLEISIPSNLLFSLREKEESFTEKVKLWLAIKLFEEGKLSLEQATELAGYSKRGFIEMLSKNKISIIIEAKRRGLLSSVQENFGELINAGIWIGNDLYDEALKLAGEQ